MLTKLPKIVLDTNSCRSAPESLGFLGYKEHLRTIGESAQIIIPETVIDEIKDDKIKYFNGQKNHIQQNPLIKIANIDIRDVVSFEVEGHVSGILAEESVNFIIYVLKRPSEAYSKIYNWSVNHQPPFEEKGDKGFKDALIACAVEELLEDEANEAVYFITKDKKLIEKFKSNTRVVLIEDFGEVSKYLYDQFVDEYLMQRIVGDLGLPAAEIVGGWLNIDDNWVLKLMESKQPYLVLVDREAREIIDSTIEVSDEEVQSLINSVSFANTQATIEALAESIKYAPINVLVELTNSALKNDQIYSIGTNDDVKDFFHPIFKKTKSYLNNDDAAKFKEYFGVVND